MMASLLDRSVRQMQREYSFLSDDYLLQTAGTKEDWIEFFSGLGVTDRPRIHTSTRQIYEWSLDELRRLTGETERDYISLRVSSIRDIRGLHYALDDIELDRPILETIQNLYTRKPPGWKDRLGCFAELLEAGWAEYGNKTKKVLRYARYFSSQCPSDTSCRTDHFWSVPQRRVLATCG